jgi:tetratricopeptide (TPR) repeat protein
MYIRRNYREPFFRDKKRGFPLRNVIIIFGIFGVLIVILLSQPSIVTNTAYAILGNAPTSTPLPREWIERANQAYIAGDLPNALVYYQEAIAQRPNNVDYLYEYGQVLIDNDDPDTALTIANRMIELAADDVRSYTLKARAMAWLRQSAAAIPVALTAQSLNTDFGGVYEALSRAYAGEARWREALDAGLLATEKDPNNVRGYWAYANALLQTGNYDLAITELETAIQINSTFLPPYFELAFLYLSLDRNQEAIDLYDRILGMQPRNARALLRQCEAYRKVGEFNRALGLCQDAVTADPSFVPAQYRLGTLRYSRREFTASKVAFEACLANQPDNLECRYLLGLTHYYLGECDMAWTILNESLVLANTRSNAESDIQIISEGLGAISLDPQCPAYSGLYETTPEATPEVTPEGDS